MVKVTPKALQTVLHADTGASTDSEPEIDKKVDLKIDTDIDLEAGVKTAADGLLDLQAPEEEIQFVPEDVEEKKTAVGDCSNNNSVWNKGKFGSAKKIDSPRFDSPRKIPERTSCGTIPETNSFHADNDNDIEQGNKMVMAMDDYCDDTHVTPRLGNHESTNVTKDTTRPESNEKIASDKPKQNMRTITVAIPEESGEEFQLAFPADLRETYERAAAAQQQQQKNNKNNRSSTRDRDNMILVGIELIERMAHFQRCQHSLADDHLRAKQFWIFTLPMGILTMTIGIMAFCATTEMVASSSESLVSDLNLVIGSISFVLVFWQTLSTQSKNESRAEMHRRAANDFRDLGSDLNRVLKKARFQMDLLVGREPSSSSKNEEQPSSQEISSILNEASDSIQDRYDRCLRGCPQTIPHRIQAAFEQLYARLDEVSSKTATKWLVQAYGGTNYEHALYTQALGDLTTLFARGWTYPLVLEGNSSKIVQDTIDKVQEKLDHAKETRLTTTNSFGGDDISSVASRSPSIKSAASQTKSSKSSKSLVFQKGNFYRRSSVDDMFDGMKKKFKR